MIENLELYALNFLLPFTSFRITENLTRLRREDFLVAGGEGIGPSLEDSKSSVLPLDDPPICPNFKQQYFTTITIQFLFVNSFELTNNACIIHI